MAQIPIASLTLHAPEGTTRNLVIDQEKTFLIGRGSSVDIVLDGEGVSRSHAMLNASLTGLVVSDLSSTNGTFLNGKKITSPHDLSSGDILDIGSWKMTVHLNATDLTQGLGSHDRGKTTQLTPRTVAVLVVKLRKIAELRGKVAPEDLLAMRSIWIEKMSECIEECDGLVDKVLDECIVCLWYDRVPQKAVEKAIAAGRSAIEITEEIHKTPEWKAFNTFRWSCVSAVNCGMALLADTRNTPNSRNFAVLGDTVNIAFQSAQIADETNTGFVMSNAVHEHLGVGLPVNTIGSFEAEKTGMEVNVIAVV